jgi:PPOX class probable F420-dependent enzyme
VIGDAMDAQTMRRLAAGSRMGHLATVSADGAPHVVPVCFALVGEVAYLAVDHKPKTTTRLRRVANIEATGHACLLVDEYDDRDWSKLWWVRLDGSGRVVDDEVEQAAALAALVDKYAQYAEQPPSGPVVALDVARFSGWSATGG